VLKPEASFSLPITSVTKQLMWYGARVGDTVEGSRGVRGDIGGDIPLTARSRHVKVK